MSPLCVCNRIVGAMSMLLASLLLMGADGKGCGGDASTGAARGNCTLQPSAYDTSCQVDSDCVAVSLGNVCADMCAGICPNAAIRSSESARYNADLAAAPASHTSGVACSCAFGPAVCRAGACAVLSAGKDTGGMAAAPQCQWPDSLNDAGPGVRACAVGRAFVECTYPSGTACGVSASGTLTELCISDDPTQCPKCGPPPSGATCHNRCGPNEYAVSCGGPPLPPLPDGGVGSIVYQDAPAGCVPAGSTPGGNTYSCCPCM
jgi:hypothetical protein